MSPVSLRSWAVAALAGLVIGPAFVSRCAAAEPDVALSAEQDERDRLSTERAAIEARFATRERECRKRFVVTSCVDDARRDRRQALDQLRSRQLAVDEARRRERTAQRRAELAEKAAEDAQRDREKRSSRQGAASAAEAASDADAPVRIRPHSQGTAGETNAAPGQPRSPAADLGLKPHVAEPMAVRARREAQSRAAYDARQHDAAAHRQVTVDRAVKRMVAKSPAASLPIPGSASAAANAASRP